MQATDPQRPSPDARCCADFYAQDWVRALADESFHPGDAELTLRTILGLELRPGSVVLDLGCGTGSTTRLLAGTFGFRAIGIDLSERSIAAATADSAVCGNRFLCADAHALPFRDASLDGVISECVLSLFQDKRHALLEIRRVARPGGRIAITDMALAGELPGDFARVVAPWTCLADAASPAAWRQLLLDLGFEVRDQHDESWALTQMIGKLKRRLIVVGAGMFATGTHSGVDIGAIRYWLDRLESLVADGTIRYLGFQLAR